MRKLLIILALIIGYTSFSQSVSELTQELRQYSRSISGIQSNKPTKKLYPAKVINGDTVIIVRLRPIIIMPPPKFTSKRQWRRYWRLVYNVKKVYPYAKLINYYYYEVNEVLKNMDDEKERERYIKQMEKYLRKKYEKQLINLTFSQGKLLIKLVDRETQKTTYEVIEEFKGRFSAQFWQAFATVFGTTLKVEYDPENNPEDRLIEYIIIQIENGQL